MITILVGSANPVKIAAAKESFAQFFSEEELHVEGIGVPSGIPDQPLSDDETFQGAKNRVENLKALGEEADFYVAFEGGAEITERGIECFAWVYGESKEGRVSYAKAATFFVPESFRAHLLAGMEMGHIVDMVTGDTNSKQKTGLIGYLTDDKLTRTEYYVHMGVCLVAQLVK